MKSSTGSEALKEISPQEPSTIGAMMAQGIPNASTMNASSGCCRTQPRKPAALGVLGRERAGAAADSVMGVLHTFLASDKRGRRPAYSMRSVGSSCGMPYDCPLKAARRDPMSCREGVGRMRTGISTAGLVSMMAVLLLAACAPSSPGQPSGSIGAEQQPAQRKVLTLAANRELLTFADFVGYGTSGGGNRTVRYIAHDYLVAEDEVRDVHPQLAIDVPSVEKGTWRVNADGTMDTVWKIPANVKWHDGAPFTADDL